MAWEKHRWRYATLLLASLLNSGGPAAQAQAPTGDGLKADYYDGVNFDRFVLSQRAASIAFDWAHQPPAPGLPAEYFSVRWTGWLRPPASGRYVFHVTVDDGMRIWLNDQLILNEWRPQPVRSFTTIVALKAGQAYRLRVDYFQDILDTRAQLTWERPDVPLAPPPSSWRNLWGLTAPAPGPEPIPTRYLFSRDPTPAPAVARSIGPALPKPPPLSPPPPLAVAKAVALPARPARRVARPAPAPPMPVAAVVVPLAEPPPTVLLADSGSTTKLVNLAVGEAVTLPKLYFNQGQARLLPKVRDALNDLAAALRARPTLRIEVQGHTDNIGSTELNRQLSQQRAEAVCLYLTAHGVAMAQLRPVGYGGTQPVADNADPAQRPRNRRVVLRRI